MPETLSVKEAANYLCVNPRTIRGGLRRQAPGRQMAGVSRSRARGKGVDFVSQARERPQIARNSLLRLFAVLAGTGASMEEF